MFIFYVATSMAAAMASDFFIYWIDSNKSEKIAISKMEGLSVNDSCAREKKECFSAIEQGLLENSSIKKDKSQAGNPASLFCQRIKGINIILQDERKNEYDYCKLDNKYLIDSWQLYKKYKK